MIDPLALLERDDKHYLGSGCGTHFAPRFPHWLERPGFWDEAGIYQYSLAPLFTVTFTEVEAGSAGEALPARQLTRRWSPAELVAIYRLDGELEGEEHRSVLPGGRFMSEWRLRNDGDRARTLLAVAWSVQSTHGLDLSSVAVRENAVRFRRALEDRRGRRLEVEVELRAPDPGVGASVYLAEDAPLDPRWELTPFPEKWRAGVRTAVQVGGVSSRGVLYLAAASLVSLPAAAETALALWAEVRPRTLTSRPALRVTASLPDAGTAADVPGPRDARVGPDGPGAASREAWRSYFESVPALRCSDPFIERYWYYRWYGLRLCAHEGGVGNHVYPGECEGVGEFHVPIAYSAQCHARELRWLPDPAPARGVILNFLAHQKESGRLHGRIYVDDLTDTDFYFADWGGAVLAVNAVHPDPDFLRAVYRPLARYAEWLERERDADGSGLIDVVDHYETGQEYMSRYMAVSDDADSETWGQRIRLKGVDATVYAYELQRALALIAGGLQEFGDAALWTAAADRTAAAVRELMWDPGVEMFSDVDPRTMRRTGVKAAVCFYPYLTDLVNAEQVTGLRRHLLNPTEFWTAYPVPSTSVDDPYYSPDAEWKGKRHKCPWNGRVWPMANSHVAEAIARAAIEHDPGLRATAVEFISRFIRMMFTHGDPARPNCFEHYNPENGRPSLYRGFDDYQHSWVNDLIVKYVAGFRPLAADAFVADPFPFGLDRLSLRGLPFRGREVEVEIAAERFRVAVDGAPAGESRIGAALEVGL